MEKKKEHYKVIIDTGNEGTAERRMNELVKEGYCLAEMSTAVDYPVHYVTIIMKKVD